MVQEADPPEIDAQKLLHELSVHQIELEAQAAELHSANAQLEASEARYRQFYDLAPVGYCTTCAKGIVIDANEMASVLLAVPIDGIVGRQLTDFILPADQDIFSLHNEKLEDGSEASNCRLRMLRQGEGFFWARLEARVVVDDGRGVRYHTAIIDITKRLEYEEYFRRFSHHLMGAREIERRALSHALHHDLGSLAVGVGSYLAVASERLAAGQTEAAMASIEASREALRQSVATLKQLAFNLRPPELEELGLAEVLWQLVEQVRASTGIDIDFSDEMGDCAVASTVAIVLYRICQEALNNAIQHAKAGKIVVSLASSKQGFNVCVRDDGIGFDWGIAETRPQGSMGLLSIAEMVSSVGGSLEVDSQPGRGTQLRVVVPHIEED
jgi:PAS domain S-box-containing protein